MMKKKIFIDLNGVVFEPVDLRFSDVARADFGRVKGAAVTLAYKYGIGRGLWRDTIAQTLNKCAMRSNVRPMAIEGIEKIAALPDVTIEFYGRVAFPEYATKLEQKYRAIAPCMNSAMHYELARPSESMRGYLASATKEDEESMNYVLGTCANDMAWPSHWRIVPIMVDGSSQDPREIRSMCGKRVFPNLMSFADYLARRR